MCGVAKNKKFKKLPNCWFSNSLRVLEPADVGQESQPFWGLWILPPALKDKGKDNKSSIIVFNREAGVGFANKVSDIQD